jgi:uncharacterized protein (TIGR03067 family)
MKWSALVLVAVAGTLAAAEDPNKKALEDLQGTWQLQRMTRGGQEAPADVVKGMRLVIAGNKMTPYEGDRAQPTATIAVDANKKPATIDLKQEREAVQGIYRLEGDTLTICAGTPGTGRPTDFASKAGTPTGLIVLKRVKK